MLRYTEMNKAEKTYDLLKSVYPDAKCGLDHDTPFQLLVSTILSAQATDKSVNAVTEELYKQYPDLESFLSLSMDELECKIRKIGLYKNKSKNIYNMCRVLKEKYGGPDLGRILVTTFNNPWNCIVRFDTGDLIRLYPSSKCSCGRDEGLIAETVEGRIANVTFTTKGNLVTTMALDTKLAEIPQIRDYHFEQNTPKSYELQVMLTDGSSGVLDRIRRALEGLYGQDGEYEIKVLANILPGPAGKFRRTQANFEFDQKELFV
jgi:endonuclease III